jgi:hypothetical protein
VSMREPNLLIFKFMSVDALASCTVLISDVSTLRHKTLYHSMENISFVMHVSSLLTCANSSEVLRCLRNLLSKNFKDYSAFRFLLIINFYVEVSLSIFRVERRELVKGFFDDDFFLVVNSLSEEFLHQLLLTGTVFLFLLF